MSADGDAMKIGAETTRQPKKIGGLDGCGWVAEIRAKPMATLPPGAAKLVVDALLNELTLSAEEEPEDFKEAIRWHRFGLATSPNAMSVQHTAAILRHLGYDRL